MKTRRGNEEGVVLTLAQFGAGIPPHQGSAVEGVRLVD
jgi:hypothetical protein